MRLIDLLAHDPRRGVVIPGSGGVRKLRFAAGGKGRSGAFRVIYYVQADDQPIYALLIYGKGEQAKPSPEQLQKMLGLVNRLKAAKA